MSVIITQGYGTGGSGSLIIVQGYGESAPHVTATPLFPGTATVRQLGPGGATVTKKTSAA